MPDLRLSAGSTPRKIGILGGMGPLATADLYRKLILATQAARDQDHLPVVIDADPRVRIAPPPCAARATTRCRPWSPGPSGCARRARRWG